MTAAGIIDLKFIFKERETETERDRDRETHRDTERQRERGTNATEQKANGSLERTWAGDPSTLNKAVFSGLTPQLQTSTALF